MDDAAGTRYRRTVITTENRQGAPQNGPSRAPGNHGEVAHDTVRRDSRTEPLGPPSGVLGTVRFWGRVGPCGHGWLCAWPFTRLRAIVSNGGRQPSAGGQTTTATCGTFVLQTW